MSQYVVVENGIITEKYDAIPENWRNVSAFNLLTDVERISFGFLSVRQSDIRFDPVRHKLISNEVELDEYQQPFINRVVEDIMTEEEYKNYKFNEALSILRNRRNSAISSSDWAVASDLVETKGDFWKNSWYSYRQQLRDITNGYKNNENIFDPDSIIFPSAPSL